MRRDRVGKRGAASRRGSLAPFRRCALPAATPSAERHSRRCWLDGFELFGKLLRQFEVPWGEEALCGPAFGPPAPKHSVGTRITGAAVRQTVLIGQEYPHAHPRGVTQASRRSLFLAICGGCLGRAGAQLPVQRLPDVLATAVHESVTLAPHFIPAQLLGW